jgi:hypothetical protein
VCVSFTDEAVTCTWPTGEVSRIKWEELQRVEIQTTDTGPFTEDVFCHLTSPVGTMMIPQGATGEPALGEHLRALPNFDRAAFIAAMRTTQNQVWLCWQRPAA